MNCNCDWLDPTSQEAISLKVRLGHTLWIFETISVVETYKDPPPPPFQKMLRKKIKRFICQIGETFAQRGAGPSENCSRKAKFMDQNVTVTWRLSN